MNRILIGLGIIFFCFSCCKKSDNPMEPPAAVPYDLSLGKTWIYAWSSVLSDSTGKILNSETDSFQVRIVSIHDTLKNYTELIRFEAQSISHFVGTETVWYRFAGDSLVEIAYSNAGATPLVLPKQSAKVVAGVKIGPPLFSLFPKSVFTLMKLKGFIDSVKLRDDIRIVYKFPLSNGRMWTSFTTPFLQTREVIGSEMLERTGKEFLCAKIQTRLPLLSPDIEWFDYVSQEGLIERCIRIKGIAIMTSDTPESIGYGYSNELLELIK